MTLPLYPEQSFDQCRNNEALETKFALLVEQNLRTQKMLEALLENIQQKEESKAHLEQLQKEQEKTVSEQTQAAHNWFDSLPWYIRYRWIIQVRAKSWINTELWPTMKALLTQMIAQKLLSQGLSQADNITSRIPLISFRLSESLTMNEDQKAHAAAERLLKTDPALKQEEENLKSLKNETLPFRLRLAQEKVRAELEKIKTLKLLEQYPSFTGLSKDVRILEHELATFIEIHDLSKRKDDLSKRKQDILDHAPTGSSTVSELTPEEMLYSLHHTPK